MEREREIERWRERERDSLPGYNTLLIENIGVCKSSIYDYDYYI